MRGRWGADQRGKGSSECVSYKDSGFYFEGGGILNHQRVLSRGVAQPACILTGSLRFLCGEQTEGEQG